MVHVCYLIAVSLAPNRPGASSRRRFSPTLRLLLGGIPFPHWLYTIPLSELHATVDYGTGKFRFHFAPHGIPVQYFCTGPGMSP